MCLRLPPEYYLEQAMAGSKLPLPLFFLPKTPAKARKLLPRQRFDFYKGKSKEAILDFLLASHPTVQYLGPQT